MRSWIKALAIGLALMGGAVAGPAAAEIVINVDQGATQPLPIAVPVFKGPAAAATQIQQVIAADLARSGLFRPNEFSCPVSWHQQPTSHRSLAPSAKSMDRH